MPPPTRVFYSYLENKQRDEDERVEDSVDHSFYMQEAKSLKHQADGERDREQQAIKYLQAVLFFTLCGNVSEQQGDKKDAYTMYKETLNLIR